MSAKASPSDQTLIGHLVIFVDGYKVIDRHLVHVYNDGVSTTSVPDRLVPPPDYEVGSMEWWEQGWAVGDNPRSRLCARSGSKPLRQFKSYDEAVAFVFARQRKHKDHRHVLVYVTARPHGEKSMDVVRSLDDVAAVDARIAKEIVEEQESSKRFDARHPYLEILRTTFGAAAALTLSSFAYDVLAKGPAAVKASMAASSFYRNIKRLKDAGIHVGSDC